MSNKICHVVKIDSVSTDDGRSKKNEAKFSLVESRLGLSFPNNSVRITIENNYIK